MHTSTGRYAKRDPFQHYYLDYYVRIIHAPAVPIGMPIIVIVGRNAGNV